MEGDILTFGDITKGNVDHIATVFATTGKTTWIIERDGHGGVFLYPYSSVNTTWGKESGVFRSNINSKPEFTFREGNKELIKEALPYELIKEKYKDLYDEVKKTGKAGKAKPFLGVTCVT